MIILTHLYVANKHSRTSVDAALCYFRYRFYEHTKKKKSGENAAYASFHTLIMKKKINKVVIL